METGGPIPLDPDIEDPIRPTRGTRRTMTGVTTETVSETTVQVEEYAAPVPGLSKLTAALKKGGKKSRKGIPKKQRVMCFLQIQRNTGRRGLDQVDWP